MPEYAGMCLYKQALGPKYAKIKKMAKFSIC